MAFFINIGYSFSVSPQAQPDGSILLASAMPMHQLQRRRVDRHAHLRQRLFDPQLYLAGLDANVSPKPCVNLISYPWIGRSVVEEYQSNQITQPDWKRQVSSQITTLWPGQPPTNSDDIEIAVQECIDFQIQQQFDYIVLPSPLTFDPATNYQTELAWLDAGLSYIRSLDSDINVPILATVAIADVCLRYSDPEQNSLIDLVTDAVGSREIQGVYLIIEQGAEPSDTRQCGTQRTLASVLHLCHVFANHSNLQVAVNFLGPFGIACRAAGATLWASNWYKSLYRLRLADKQAGGRAYPSYWTRHAALDIHLDGEFDSLRQAGILRVVADQTGASSNLLQAAARNTPVNQVPAWRYAQSNVTAAMEHFQISAVEMEAHYQQFGQPQMIQHVDSWLNQASGHARRISSALGSSASTKHQHVEAWHRAFQHYRRVHNV